MDFPNLNPEYNDSDATTQKKLLAAINLLVAAIAGGTSNDEFTSNISTLTSSTGSIPVGCKSWSVSCISGTVTVDGQTLPVGAQVGGGGYGARGLKTALAVVATSGVALISYDTFA